MFFITIRIIQELYRAVVIRECGERTALFPLSQFQGHGREYAKKTMLLVWERSGGRESQCAQG